MKKVLIISTVGLIYDGITSVILSYLNAMDLSKFEIHVAATIRVEPNIKCQIENLGCKVVDFPNRRTDTKDYALTLLKYIRNRKIEVVHVHGNSATMAIEMCAAWLGGCKKRIAHSHNTRCDQVRADKLLRPIFNLLYTHALACGDEAGKWLFSNRPFIVLRNGRDIDKFRYNSSIRKFMRDRFGIADELVIGHVGGFFEQKNHAFLIKIFREIVKQAPNTKCYLIGDGPLRAKIEQSSSDLSKNIFFTGITDDVPSYLQMMDVMILPSLFEGLPLVAVEWQISGLPCLLSDTITRECAVTPLVEFESLSSAPNVWTRKVINMAEKNKTEKRGIYGDQVAKAGFGITENSKVLESLYLS